MNRKDLYVGPLHIIIRGYKDDPQYGTLWWGWKGSRTLDIWFHQKLITIKKGRNVEW